MIKTWEVTKHHSWRIVLVKKVSQKAVLDSRGGVYRRHEYREHGTWWWGWWEEEEASFETSYHTSRGLWASYLLTLYASFFSPVKCGNASYFIELLCGANEVIMYEKQFTMCCGSISHYYYSRVRNEAFLWLISASQCLWNIWRSWAAP